MLLTGWLIGRSRLGLALRVIGDDEVVARHAGIDTTRAKLALFAISALFMTADRRRDGAALDLYRSGDRLQSPMLSFEVVIMALLGGAGALFGPLLGVVPLVLLFEVLSANFPNYFSILLGIVFVLIVYVLPRGVIGLIPARPPARAGRGRGCRPRERPRTARRLEVDRPAQGVRRPGRGRRHLASRVARGEIVGLIGPNGSGKTTVLNLISGALVGRCRRDPLQGARSRRHCRRIASRGSASRARSSWCACSNRMTVIENVMVGLRVPRARR